MLSFQGEGIKYLFIFERGEFFLFLNGKFLFGVEILVEFFVFPVSSFDSLSGRKRLFGFLILDLVFFFLDGY